MEDINLDKNNYPIRLSVNFDQYEEFPLEVSGRMVKYLININKPPFCGMITGSPCLALSGEGYIESKSTGLQCVLSAIKAAAEAYQN